MVYRIAKQRMTARQDSHPSARHVTGAAMLTGALLVAALAGAPGAGAGPDPAPSCAFTLSSPVATEVPGGAGGVTATLSPGACTGQPVVLMVCLTTASGRSECGKSYAFDAARVVMVTSPKGVFTATGRGCWHPGLDADERCETRGPISVTL